MSEQQIKIEMLAKDQAAVKALQSVERAVDKIAQRLGDVERKSKSAGDSTRNVFSDATRQAMQFAGAVTGIGSVLGAVVAAANQLRREYENIKQRQAEAAGTQLGFADQLKEAVINAAGLYSSDELEKQARAIGVSTGAGATKAAGAFAGALSALGPTNKEQASEAMRAAQAALKLAPQLETDELTQLAGAAIDITKNVKDKKSATPEAAMGFLLNVGSLARTTNVHELVRNVAPGVANVAEHMPMQSAGALVAAITQGSRDFTGRFSRTASIRLAEQIHERFPQGNVEDIIAQAQGDPKFRHKLLNTGGRFPGGKFSGMSFEATTTGAVTRLLTGGTYEANKFAEGKQAIGGFERGKQQYDYFVGQFDKSTTLLTSKLDHILKSNIAEIQLGDTKGARTGLARKGLEDALRAAGVSVTEQDFARFGFELNGGINQRAPVTRVADALRQKAEGLVNPPAEVAVSAGVGAPGIILPGRQVTDDDRRNSEALKNLADQLIKAIGDREKPQKVEVINIPRRQPVAAQRPTAAHSRPP